jgi:hypothetical protein
MLTIWKFQIDQDALWKAIKTQVAVRAEIPTLATAAQIKHVEFQGHDLCLWALTDPREPMASGAPRSVFVAATGAAIPSDAKYIGTATRRDSLVFHVFE